MHQGVPVFRQTYGKAGYSYDFAIVQGKEGLGPRIILIPPQGHWKQTGEGGRDNSFKPYPATRKARSIIYLTKYPAATPDSS
ncbi:TPA: hypothetical protein ACH3X1_010606 [Trebouxia sp. C0004]